MLLSKQWVRFIPAQYLTNENKCWPQCLSRFNQRISAHTVFRVRLLRSILWSCARALAYSFSRVLECCVLLCSNVRVLVCSCARMFACSCVRVLVWSWWSCARVFVYSCARVLVCSCARVLMCSCAPLFNMNLMESSATCRSCTYAECVTIALFSGHHFADMRPISLSWELLLLLLSPILLHNKKNERRQVHRKKSRKTVLICKKVKPLRNK